MHLTEIFTQKLAQEVLNKYMLVPYFPCKLFLFFYYKSIFAENLGRDSPALNSGFFIPLCLRMFVSMNKQYQVWDGDEWLQVC